MSVKWLVGTVISIVAALFTLILWVRYELRQHRGRKLVKEMGEEQVSARRRPKPFEKRFEDESIFILVMIFAIAMVDTTSHSWLNTVGMQWVPCEVTSVKVTERTRRFSGRTLRFQTRECGQIGLSNEGSETLEQIAESCKPGTTHEFRLSVYDRWNIENKPDQAVGTDAWR